MRSPPTLPPPENLKRALKIGFAVEHTEHRNMVKLEHIQETDLAFFMQVCAVVDKSLYGQVVGIYFHF